MNQRTFFFTSLEAYSVLILSISEVRVVDTHLSVSSGYIQALTYTIKLDFEAQKFKLST